MAIGPVCPIKQPAVLAAEHLPMIGCTGDLDQRVLTCIVIGSLVSSLSEAVYYTDPNATHKMAGVHSSLGGDQVGVAGEPNLHC